MSREEELLNRLSFTEHRYQSLLGQLHEIIFELQPDSKLSYVNRVWADQLGFSVDGSLGTPLTDFVVEDQKPILRRLLEEAKQSGAAPRKIEAAFRHRDGSTVWFEMSVRRGEGDRLLGVLREINDKRKVEEERVRQARLSALRADVGTVLNQDLPLRDMLQQCCEIILFHIDAVFVRVWTLQEHERVLVLQASAGLYTHVDGPHSRIPVGAMKIGAIAESQQPVLTNDVAGDPRIADKDWARAERMRSFAGYPLLCASRLVGVIALFSRVPLSDDTLSTLKVAADVVALGVLRKEAEARLRESEARLRLGVAVSGLAIAQIDYEADVVRFGPEAAEMFGLPAAPGAISRNEFHAMFHPDDRAEALRCLERAQAPGGDGMFDMELRFVRPDGAVRWLALRKQMFFDQSRPVPRLKHGLLAAQDITRRKQAEDARLHAEVRQRTVIKTALDCIITIDHDGNVLEFNPAAERTFGYRRDEVMGRPIGELIVPERLREAHAIGMRKYRETGEGPVLGKRIEIVALRKGGEEFPVELAITPIDQGEGPVFTAYLRDITERKRSEAALREQQLRVQVILDHTAQFIGMLSPEGRLLEANHTALDFVRVEKKDVVGKLFWETPWWNHSEDLQYRVRNAVAHAAAGEAVRFEATHRSAAGQIRHVDFSLSPVLDAGGHTVMLIPSGHDVTEWRRAERREAAQHEVTRILNEAESLSEAITLVLRTIGENLEWSLGTLFVVDRDEEVLRCSHVWHAGGAALERFAESTRKTVFHPGEGLPGRAWRNRFPVWVADLAGDVTFVRGQAAFDAGLCSGLAFCIIVDDEVNGVLEFFSTAQHEEEHDLLGTLATIGNQIGLYIERKGAVERLRQSEAELADFFENGAVGLHWLKPDGTIERANRTELNLLGYKREEFVGRNIADFHTDPGIVRDALGRLAAGDANCTYEASVRCRDGATRQVYVNCIAHKPRGAFEQARCFTYDITERRLAEAERDRFFTLSLDLFWIAGFDGRFTRLNQAWERVLGWSEAELLGQKFLDFVLTDDRPAVAGEFERLTREASSAADFEFRVRCKDGSNRWLLASAVSAPQDQLVYADAKDVTEQKRIAQALLDRDARIRAIVESAVDGIIVIDDRGVIESFNPAAESMFGYASAEMIGRNVKALMPEPDHSRHDDYIANYLRDRVPKVIGRGRETLGKRKDGTTFPLELTIGEMSLENNHRFTGIVRDISKRKQVEEELKAAMDAATAATRAKSDFLANISHEVRTPMTAIIGNADLLLDPQLSKKSKMAAVNAIRRNGEHLLQLINDILDLSKIEAGKLDIDLLWCSPWELTLAVISFLRVSAEERRLRIKVTAEGQLPRHCMSDPTRLRQILMNFLSNAIKFSKPGEEIRVVLSTRSAPLRLCFEVADRGIGMNPEQMSRLFQPFEQADTSSTRKYGGTGLGLTISKRLAEALGGKIEVESSLGVGSVFRLLLPLQSQSGLEWIEGGHLREALWVDNAVDTESALRRFSGRVLLAEDSQDIQRVLTYYLRRAGIDVDTAENGRVAVEKAMERPYDLILMDMQMPELDGLNATGVLRRSGYTGPIVALTAHAMRDDRDRYMSGGLNDYLTKPISVGRLLSEVGKYLVEIKSPAESYEIANSWAGTEVVYPTGTPGDGGDPPKRGSKHGEKLKEQSSSKSGEFAALYREYVKDLPSQIEKMEVALHTGDLLELQTLAHRLKGSGAMYGLPELSETAGLIEDAVKEGQEPSLLIELLGEFREIIHKLGTPD